jgi:hypothetical protein
VLELDAALLAQQRADEVRCGARGRRAEIGAGLALAQARNSGTVFTLAGTAGPTAKPKSKMQAMLTGVRSAIGSYGSFL